MGKSYLDGVKFPRNLAEGILKETVGDGVLTIVGKWYRVETANTNFLLF